MKTMQPPGGGPQTVCDPIPNLLLRDARKRNRWTQKEVAEKIGVSALAVGRWERGETVPFPYARLKLCGLFNMSAEELGLPGGKETQPTQQPGVGADFDDLGATPDKENHLSWYEVLKRERQMRGWSQFDVAVRIDSVPKSVSRWEKGDIYPSPHYLQRLIELYGLDAETLEILTAGSPHRTLTINLPVQCGDCEQPEFTGILDTIRIDPSKDRTTFYFRFTNGTAENVGLRFESISLLDPLGDFSLGRSIGSFHLAAGQSIPLSMIFDMTLEKNTLYRLHIVLIRPDKWRNTYRPIPITL